MITSRAILKRRHRGGKSSRARADDNDVGIVGLIHSLRRFRRAVINRHIRAGCIQRIAHGGKNRIAGCRRAGNAIHTGSLIFNNRRWNTFNRIRTDAHGFIVADHFNLFNRRFADSGCHGHIRAIAAICKLIGSGSHGLACRLHQSRLTHRILECLAHSAAGHGCAGNAVKLRRLRFYNRPTEGFNSLTANRGGLVIARNNRIGYSSILNRNGNGYVAAKAFGRSGERILVFRHSQP